MAQVNSFPQHALGVMPRVWGRKLLTQSIILAVRGLNRAGNVFTVVYSTGFSPQYKLKGGPPFPFFVPSFRVLLKFYHLSPFSLKNRLFQYQITIFSNSTKIISKSAQNHILFRCIGCNFWLPPSYFGELGKTLQ